MSEGSHPVRLVMPYPQEFSRLQALFFTFLGFIGPLILIPHVFVIFFLGIAAYFINIIAWFAILFTGRYPKGMWEFMRKLLRYGMRINAYMGVLTVGYPPIGPGEENYGLELEVPYPEKSSRLWIFFAGIAAIPVMFWNAIIGIWAGILGFIGKFVVLFTGRFPEGWYDFLRRFMQQGARINCFVLWLRNEYPPFGLKD